MAPFSCVPEGGSVFRFLPLFFRFAVVCFDWNERIKGNGEVVGVGREGGGVMLGSGVCSTVKRRDGFVV